ncbi:hypothetical protein JCM15519_06860 [Fundidesulfovibrio butyratiphilus]
MGAPVINTFPATRAMDLCRGYDETLETFELVMKVERRLFPLRAEQAVEAAKAREDQD